MIQVEVLHSARLKVRVLRQSPEVEMVQLERVRLHATQITHHLAVDGADAADADERPEVERYLRLVDALDVG